MRSAPVRRRGRPSRRDEPAWCRLVLRVTQREHAEMGVAARENGISTAELVRQAVDEFVADYRERVVFQPTRRVMYSRNPDAAGY